MPRHILRPIALAGLVLTAMPAAADEARVPQSRGEMALSFAPVVRASAPAVVNIYARRVVPARRSPFAGDPFFERFFGSRTVPRLQNSLGSGVIVSEDGIVVSNHHVVGNAAEIRVVLPDRREFDAEVLLADPDRDLAVLRLDTDVPLPALGFADSDAAEVGDLVLAIGNPFGVGQTVTGGIVSGLARCTGPGMGGTGAAYFIQTDAAINPGNSGGALVDMDGRLIGVNTSILTRSGGSNGIGFAIPANLVRAYVDRARAGSEGPGFPWAGLEGQPVDADLAATLGLSRPEGVLVAEPHPQSPSARAGFAPGDVILRIDGGEVGSMAELEYRLLIRSPGSEMACEVLRDGQVTALSVLADPAPDQPPRDPRSVSGTGPLAGTVVETVNPVLIDAFGLPLSARGAMVSRVSDRGYRLGLRAGDIVLAVNREPVSTSAEAVGRLERLGRSGALTLLRDGRRISLRFAG